MSELRLHARGSGDVDRPDEGPDHWRGGVKAVNNGNFDHLRQGAEVRAVDENEGATAGGLVAGCQRRGWRLRAANRRLANVDRLCVRLLAQHGDNLRVGEAGTVRIGVGCAKSGATASESRSGHIVKT